MSLNFNGSTAKRRINLGNRNLTAKNKTTFLKNTQQERFKREQDKKRINAAVIIQSRLRSYVDLQHARIVIAQNWTGNLIEFKFFFENLIKFQDTQTSLNQLQTIESQCLDCNTIELKIVAQTLISTISKFDLSVKTNLILAEKILDVLLAFLDKLSLDDNLESLKFDGLLKFLIHLYYLNHKSILPFIFQYSKFKSFVLITYFFSNPYNDFIDESINQNLTVELTQSLTNQFNMITLYQQDTKNLSDTKKLGFLRNVSEIFFEVPQIDYQVFLNSNSIFALSKFFGEINTTLNIVGNENETYLFADDSNYSIQISENTYKEITKFYKADFSKKLSFLNLNIDLLISFVYSLLQFASLLSSHQQENSNLKSSLIINLMTSSTLLKDLYSKISENEFYQTLSTLNFNAIDSIDLRNPIDFAKLWEFIFDLENTHWWHLFYVFQENYLILLLVSNDDGLFSQNRMNKKDFKSFIIFLKNFVSFVILDYRNFIKSKDNKINLMLFLKATKISIKLLKQIYLRNLRMKLYDENFWLLKNFEFNVKIILPLLKSVENIHDDSNIDEEVLELQDYDYLESSNLIKSFNKNITKLQIDSIFVLTYIPYMISFEKRAEIFHSLIQINKESFANNWFPKKMEGTISRESVFLDSFENFGSLKGTEFKNQFSVQFINKFGETEAGIDGGGLTKELLTSLVNSSFVPSIENKERNAGFEFFKEAVNHKLYPNSEFYFKLQFQKQNAKNENIFPVETRILYLQMLRFLGMVIGKCMYENVLINISFAPFFLNKWSQLNNDSSFKKNFMGDLTEGSINRNSFDDLIGYDLQTYQSLSQILNTKDESDLKSMGLTFTTTDSFRKSDGSLQYVNVNLISNGDKINVNLSNKLEFSYCITKFKLDQQISIQSNYFLEGLFQVIKPHWLSLFNPYELQTLISGGDEDIDINDLEKNVEFGGYLKNDTTIEYLFEILREFNNENKCKFLKFVTSSSRQPLLGFKELYPKFGIRNSGSDLNRLPTSSTCVNLLKLPDYKDKNLLKQKLLYSINSEAGFDLS